jgi:hypothetical protein
MSNTSLQTVIAFVIGVFVGAGLVHLFLQPTTGHDYAHPIADPTDDKYHVHADFRIFVGDTQVELTDDSFMTTAMNMVSEHAHLHDGNGEVEHIHAEDLTFSHFLDSLDITLTDNCLTLFEEEGLCSGEEQEVLLFVNEELYTQPLTQYIPIDDDRILLYYGNSQNENIETYIQAIPSDSCYYSGTCPERGIAPPENCGLTCEL